MGLGMSHVQRRIGSKRSRACPSRPMLATASEHLLLDAHTDTQTTSTLPSRPRLTARSGTCWPAGTRPHGIVEAPGVRSDLAATHTPNWNVSRDAAART
jgi:hypothetical protein